MAHVPVIPAMLGSTDKRITVQASPGINQDPISKITNVEEAQVVEYLPRQHEALNSTPTTTKNLKP
jgi:hypothetical protein